MLKKHFYKFSVVIASLFFSFILWVISLANTGGHIIFFDLIKNIPYGDKVGHCLLFGTLTYVTNLALKFKSFRCIKWRLYFGSSLVLTFVVIEELSQGFIDTRTLDVADLIADVVGIGLFSYFSWLTHKLLLNNDQKD